MATAALSITIQLAAKGEIAAMTSSELVIALPPGFGNKGVLFKVDFCL